MCPVKLIGRVRMERLGGAIDAIARMRGHGIEGVREAATLSINQIKRYGGFVLELIHGMLSSRRA